IYATLERQGQRLMEGIRSVLTRAGMEHRIQGCPPIFHLALGTSAPITDYRTSLAADPVRYVRLCSALLPRGGPALERGAWFLSTAHTDAVIDATLEAFGDAVKSL